MSTSKEVEIQFLASNMTSLDDPDTLNFEATFEFIKESHFCKDAGKKIGPSGIVDLTQAEVRIAIF